MSLAALCALVLVPVLAGCSDATAVQVDPPETGACRVLDGPLVDADSNDSTVLECSEPHNAETFAVGELPAALHDVPREDRRIGAAAFDVCQPRFVEHLGADTSLARRTVLSWVWFRPSAEQWAAGARWLRCDVVGAEVGGDAERRLRPLPARTEGLLAGVPDDEWMACVATETVPDQPRVPCSEPHRWRAATIVRLGKPDTPYPGARLTEVRSRDFCSSSLMGFLGYPATFQFAWTWPQRGEWRTGERTAICWARADAIRSATQPPNPEEDGK